MRLPLPRPVCLLLYSCLILPFFSHIADLPGLACLNHLSTGVKSKCSPSVCARLHNSCWCEAKESGERLGEEGHGEVGWGGGGGVAPAAAGEAAGGHQNVHGWQHSDKWCFFFFFKFRPPFPASNPAVWLQTRPCPAPPQGPAWGLAWHPEDVCGFTPTKFYPLSEIF